MSVIHPSIEYQCVKTCLQEYYTRIKTSVLDRNCLKFWSVTKLNIISGCCLSHSWRNAFTWASADLLSILSQLISSEINQDTSKRKENKTKFDPASSCRPLCSALNVRSYNKIITWRGNWDIHQCIAYSGMYDNTSQRRHDAIITALLRPNDVAVSFGRNTDASIVPLVRWDVHKEMHVLQTRNSQR